MSTNVRNESDMTFIESSLLNGFRGIVFVFNYFNLNFILSLTQRIIVASFQLWLSSIAILWSAAFIYSMFYYIYIPLVSTTQEIYFQFDSRCDSDMTPNCEKPFARIPLAKYSRNGEFSRGQLYRFAIDLHLPESDVNWNQGMFMIRIKLFDDNENTVVNAAKPAILKFKSPLTRVINTMFYWPLYVVGFMEESQTLSIILIEDFVEGSYLNVGPVTHTIIEVEARNIQISAPTLLKISAHLTGLRYYMYYWPLTSAAIGISTIAFFIYFLTLISNSKSSKSDENEKIEDKSVFDEQNDVSNNVCLNNSESVMSGENESESDESSTLVIQEIDDLQINDEESNPLPDSSVQ